MTERDNSNLSIPKGLRGPAGDFAAYAERELDRRRNSNPEFDRDAHEEALRLVFRKLGVELKGEQK